MMMLLLLLFRMATVFVVIVLHKSTKLKCEGHRLNIIFIITVLFVVDVDAVTVVVIFIISDGGNDGNVSIQ